MRAIYAGSFSPPTLGHLDVIERAASLFDELIVAVLSQQAKHYLFSVEEREEMLRKIVAGRNNVRVISDTGLLVDVVRREKADVIVRGLRNETDWTFEAQIAEANRRIGGVETLFLSSRPEFCMISSTIVRDCASHGAPIEAMVPRQIARQIYDAFGVRPETERKG